MIFYNCSTCGILTKESIKMQDLNGSPILICKCCKNEVFPDVDFVDLESETVSKELEQELFDLSYDLSKELLGSSLVSLMSKGIVTVAGLDELGQEVIELTPFGVKVAEELQKGKKK